MRQTEMPNDILKLLELGLDLVTLGGETYRCEDWNDTTNQAKTYERIKKALEDPTIMIREDGKQVSSNSSRWGGRISLWGD